MRQTGRNMPAELQLGTLATIGSMVAGVRASAEPFSRKVHARPPREQASIVTL